MYCISYKTDLRFKQCVLGLPFPFNTQLNCINLMWILLLVFFKSLLLVAQAKGISMVENLDPEGFYEGPETICQPDMSLASVKIIQMVGFGLKQNFTHMYK